MNFEFKTNQFSLLVKPDLSVHLQKISEVGDRVELVVQTKFCSYSINIENTKKLQILLPLLQLEVQTILATYQLKLITNSFNIQDNTCYFDFTTKEVSL
ncbi:hypothetical protein [Listeria welshimeri]|uniref:hypothetical protein n=1 Tax=Listeria welshimeri TaxID=1643 RepID=UPI0018878D99|nr:hypothetical protein [Listeria welshimeri]MBF2508702.1 hypothetical protein [Listeria welshimeri]MBF2601563.1 hypothetical protein [Listeria welshimeri]MBF2696769.1 hypothetical protein [Listeria welshimeri]